MVNRHVKEAFTDVWLHFLRSHKLQKTTQIQIFGDCSASSLVVMEENVPKSAFVAKVIQSVQWNI